MTADAESTDDNRRDCPFGHGWQVIETYWGRPIAVVCCFCGEKYAIAERVKG